MAKYYLDTEFVEGPQTRRICGIPIGKTKPTIDLISIGIVAKDDREYYAISKDFNLREAWERFDEIIEPTSGDVKNIFPEGRKKKFYWLRENVLKPIFYEWIGKDINFHDYDYMFTFNEFKKLMHKHGKTNKQIANEIFEFVNPDLGFAVESYRNSELKPGGRLFDHFKKHNAAEHEGRFVAQPDFYAYYSAYDWVVFCQLFGTMNDIPKGFPMFCYDLKQIMDEKANELMNKVCYESGNHTIWSLNKALSQIKESAYYPINENPHHALSDAHWDKKLHEFLLNT